MELSPKIVVFQKLKGNKHHSVEKGVEVSMVQRKFNVATLLGKISSVATLGVESLESMAMSRHQLEKGKQIQKCRDIISNSNGQIMPIIQCRNITTIWLRHQLRKGRTASFKCLNIKIMSRH